MIVIAVLANITAFWRVAHCYKALNERDGKN
jgi:CDP-diacylglycerol--glycerol-3-phosphate 3-phosphatidyltransferase